MLRVQIGVNILYATLSEREVVASPVYSMELTPIEAKTNKKVVVPVDLSVDSDRVNQIQIELVSDANTEDLPSGKVFLAGGDYIYKISDQSNELETGLLRYDTKLDESQYNNNITEKVYNG